MSDSEDVVLCATNMEPSTSREQGSCPQQQNRLREWNPEHKIFLSHSGEQKEFVRQLCKDLEVETHQPFFDERSSSLPKGEPFALLIFEAAKQCLVAVVLLSEEFLKSKWPMLELVEFVKAKKSHNPKLKLFPLFYKLSPDDLKDESIKNRWRAAWQEFATTPGPHDLLVASNDTRKRVSLSLSSCTEAIRELRAINGPRFEKFSSEVSYREAIVTQISLLVPPDLLDDTSDVIGEERLCKVVAGMFVEDTSDESKQRGTQKLGLYGVGGLGKTTMCRAMCMFFYKDFNGRVFHVELGTSLSPLDLQKLVLTNLLRISKDVVARVHTEHQGRKLLKEHMRRHRVFLVIDNISVDRTEASTYLEAGFHPGSMIMITSRSRDIVLELFPSRENLTYCKAMASLSEKEAEFIFLQRAAPQRKLETLTIEEQKILKVCLDQGHFLSVDGEGQYHPLALQALADYYHTHDSWNLLTWKEHLEDLDKLILSEFSTPIFRVLGLQFSTWDSKKKLLFLDVCLCIEGTPLDDTFERRVGWLADVNEKEPSAVEHELQIFNRCGIITIKSIFGDRLITIHDLYVEFAKWYVIEGKGSRCAVYHTKSTTSLPDVLKRSSATSSELRRIRLENLKCTKFPLKKVQEWCNVVVLQLYRCSGLKMLDLHGLSCLRVLELKYLDNLETFDFVESKSDSTKESHGTCESLQHVVLEYLESLEHLPDFNLCKSLKSFHMYHCYAGISVPPSFEGCSQLESFLYLPWNWNWKKIQLNTLTSLTSLALINHIGYLSMIRYGRRDLGLEDGTPGSDEPENNLELLGLDACTQLEILSLSKLPIKCLPGLEKLTKLQSLEVKGCEFLEDFPDLSALAVLERLSLVKLSIISLPGLEKLRKLQSLEVKGCEFLEDFPDLSALAVLGRLSLVRLPIKCLPGLEKLTKLQSLEVKGCEFLEDFPDLSALAVLERLSLVELPIISLPGLEKLTKLQSLEVKGCEFLEDFPDLSALAVLERLSLVELPSRSLPGLEKLTKLQSLEVKGCEFLEDFPDLSALAVLERLSLVELPSRSLPGLEKLTKLQSLEVKGCEFLEDFPDLSALAVLERLSLVELPIKCLPGLEKLTKLQSLEVKGCEFLEDFPYLSALAVLGRLSLGKLPSRSLPGLEKLTKLRSLEVRDCKSLEQFPDLSALAVLERLSLVGLSIISLPGLEKLTKLQSLQVRGCKSLEQFPDLSALAVLERLSLVGLSIISLPGLEKLTKLQSLEVKGCEFLEDFPDLSALAVLERLSLVKLSIISLPGLEKLRKLQSLEVKGCEFLEDFPDLSALAVLERLSLVRLPIISLPVLEKLTKLQSLQVEGCKSLEQFPDLSALPVLESLCLRAINIMRVPALERLLQLSDFRCTSCPKLITLPDLDHLPNLTIAYIIDCESLMNEPRLPPHCSTVEGGIEAIAESDRRSVSSFKPLQQLWIAYGNAAKSQ